MDKYKYDANDENTAGDDADRQHENMDKFYKSAVSSLFEDDETKESEPPGRAEAPLRRPGSYMREADPEKQYQEYLSRAYEASRIERERQAAEKEKAKSELDQQLEELAEIPQRRREEFARTRGRGGGTLNLRNIAAVALVVIVVVFAILVFQATAARSDLRDARAQLDAFHGLQEEYLALRSEYLVQAGRITDLQNQLNELLGITDNDYDYDPPYGDENGDDYTAQGDPTTPPDEPYTPTTPPTTTTQPPGQNVATLPYTTVNAQGQLVYSVQEGDNFWSIAVRVLGDGARYPEIMAANNITDPGQLFPGTSIIIPN